jgi:hypothetical protein
MNHEKIPTEINVGRIFCGSLKIVNKRYKDI